jgi:hypothetical protein
MLSMVRGVDAERIQQTLASIGGAQAQVEALARFQAKHAIKSVVLNDAQFKGGRAARAIAGDVARFLGVPEHAALHYVTTKHRANGFTAASFDHVVVKRPAKAKRVPGEGARAKQAVADAVAARHNDDSPAWSVTAAFRAMDRDIDSVITTWVHEIGHQVHFYAGAPDVPAGYPRLTTVADLTMYEWHAEHFAAWVFNREALADWSLEVAAYMDDLIERAIKSRVKKR